MKTGNNNFSPKKAGELIQRLQLLHTHMVSTDEAESKSLSSYLHDSVVQVLSAVHMQLSMLVFEYPQLADSALPDSLTMVADLAEDLVMTARKLWPLDLSSLGLNAVLQQVCEDFSQLVQIPIIYLGTELPDLPEATAIAFYRLIQAQLTNIREHAQATNVWVTLQVDGRSVGLTIKDNGRGFDDDGQVIDCANVPGLSLLGLMVRFRQLNGLLSIHSARGQGTTITAVLPYTHTNDLSAI